MGKRLRLFFILSTFLSLGLAAQPIKAVVPQLSPAATDVYQKLAQAVVEASGRTVTLEVLPFARTVYMMETKQADLLSSIVQIPDTKKWAALKYDYSTSEVIKIVFVLYTNKAKPINMADLKSGKATGLKIETDGAHLDHFPFATSPSTSVDASLKKVDSGEIDGYLFSQGSGDAALKRLGYKNIVRIYYETFTASFLLQKGARGGALDKALTDGLAKIKASGKFNEIAGAYVSTASKFIDWQP